MNILIRSLMLKKQKGDSSSKDAKGTAANEASRKRCYIYFFLGYITHDVSYLYLMLMRLNFYSCFQCPKMAGVCLLHTCMHI